jgi:hypothetical protein
MSVSLSLNPTPVASEGTRLLLKGLLLLLGLLSLLLRELSLLLRLLLLFLLQRGGGEREHAKMDVDQSVLGMVRRES